MLTKQDFIDRDYREYFGSNFKLADYLLQKRVRNDDGKTKYFIDVWVYDYSKHPQLKNMNPQLQFSAECRFYDFAERMYTFEIHNFDTIEFMETKMEEVFVGMRFICDPHND